MQFLRQLIARWIKAPTTQRPLQPLRDDELAKAVGGAESSRFKGW